MPRYAIAFHPAGEGVIQKVVEMDSEEAALRFFFHSFAGNQYTKDDEGYVYFSEDFHDPDDALGSILAI